MSDAIERLRKARSIEIKVKHVTFTATRYTAEQYAVYMRDDVTLAEICRRHVTGWAGVTEKDVFGEGDGVVPFDAELFSEVIAERADWSKEIFTQMGRAYSDFLDKCSKATKK